MVACSSPSEELAEQIIESQEGVGDVEIDEEGGEVSVETDDGSMTLGEARSQKTSPSMSRLVVRSRPSSSRETARR